MRRMNDLDAEGGRRLAQKCEVDTHMHSSGLRQWPCSASQPGRHLAVTKRIHSLAHHETKRTHNERRISLIYAEGCERLIT